MHDQRIKKVPPWAKKKTRETANERDGKNGIKKRNANNLLDLPMLFAVSTVAGLFFFFFGRGIGASTALYSFICSFSRIILTFIERLLVLCSSIPIKHLIHPGLLFQFQRRDITARDPAKSRYKRWDNTKIRGSERLHFRYVNFPS